MLMVGGRKRNKGNNTDIFDLHFTQTIDNRELTGELTDNVQML